MKIQRGNPLKMNKLKNIIENICLLKWYYLTLYVIFVIGFEIIQAGMKRNLFSSFSRFMSKGSRHRLAETF